MIELGGNIILVGFKDLEPAKLIVVKKMVGTYAKKIAEKIELKELKLELKQTHSKGKKEEKQKYEVKAKAKTDKKEYNSDTIQFNLFYALDEVLGKIIAQIE